MAIKTHDKQSIKVPNQIQSYLIRIVKRYFDQEISTTKESIEAIVVESFRRLKETIVLDKSSVFVLNGKTGHVKLSIQDLHGEPIIETKCSAFNKSFGDMLETICEGNDDRLFDKREPLEHAHLYSDINDLYDSIRNIENKLNDIVKQNHEHKNNSVLNIIQYSGKNDMIDLAVLWKIIDNIKLNMKLFQIDSNNVKGQSKNNINKLQELYDTLTRQYEKMVHDSIETYSWLSEISIYYRNKCIDTLMKEITGYSIDEYYKTFPLKCLKRKQGMVEYKALDDNYPTITYGKSKTTIEYKFEHSYDAFNGTGWTFNDVIKVGIRTKDGKRYSMPNKIYIEGFCITVTVYYTNEEIVLDFYAKKEIPIGNLNSTMLCDGRYYKYYTNAKTWNDAESDCKKNGGHLAVITSQKSNDAVKKLIQDSTNPVWIGGKFNTKDSCYHWNEGNLLFDYTNWNTKEDTNLNNVVQMNKDGTWNSSLESEQRTYVCSWNIENPMNIFFKDAGIEFWAYGYEEETNNE